MNFTSDDIPTCKPQLTACENAEIRLNGMTTGLRLTLETYLAFAWALGDDEIIDNVMVMMVAQMKIRQRLDARDSQS